MSVAPAHGLEVQFTATWGALTVTVAALDINDPMRHVVIGGHEDPHEPGEGVGSSRDEYNHVATRVELFAPGQTTPIATWHAPGGWSEEDAFTFTQMVDGASAPIGTWRCRTRNEDHKAAQTSLAVLHNFNRQPLRTKPTPQMLVDHAYVLILEALMPSAAIEGRYVNYSFGAPLREFFGDSPPDVLGTHRMEMPFGLQGTGELQKLKILASYGQKFLDAMLLEWQTRKFDLEAKLAQAQAMGPQGNAQVIVYQQKLRDNDAWRADLEARVPPDAAIIHAKVAISNVHLEREFDLVLGSITVDIADIEHALADIYIAFDARLQDVASFAATPIELTGGVANLAEELGLIPELNVIVNELLVEATNVARPYIARYLGEALARLVAHEGVFMRLYADEQNWRVDYTYVPTDRLPLPGPGPIIVVDGGPIVEPDPGPLGQMPPEFVIVAPTGSPARPASYTETLDKIDHIVIVMMENRSFDHMLGYLGKPAGSRYEGVRGRHTNPLSGRAEPVSLARAHDVLPSPSTRVPFSPEHGICHVKDQVANGEMSGFAQDYENGHPGLGPYVMTYYTEEEVAVYDRLAREHGVCDHWHAAFPGGTWPNRWITLSGFTPDINNLAVDDSRIGFLPGPTIFETLTRYGVSWALFESDLSLIRTYDRYRLDTEHVMPFYNWHDKEHGFEETCKRYWLPQVTFVEPNFRDIPPLSTANDDLAPADVLRGQQFICRVVNAVRSAPTWDKTLLLITYDEHGGFYDHVPPPGTDKGPDEWKGRVPDVALHPSEDCPSNFMGVRVPAIVVSPFVGPGSVCKQVFGHTSIIKTILLRWRAKFPASVFTQFGPRVNIAADLGLALDNPAPPIEARSPIPRPGRSLNVPPGPARQRRVETDDFSAALSYGFLPRRSS